MKPSSNPHITVILLLSFLAVVTVSCKEAIKSFSDMSTLRNELIREYKEPDVGVVVQNSHILVITFNNSSFNKLIDEERGKKAIAIAYFAKAHYASINSIDKIIIAFSLSKDYIVFHYSMNLATYRFDKTALIAAKGPESFGAESEGDAVVSYNPTSNETNVYLKANLQLNDKLGSSVSLLPRFTVAQTNVRVSKIPESVSLDFISYAKKRTFPDDAKFELYVNGQKIFSGKARLTSVMGTDAEQSVNEFLTQEIPYDQFLQLANSGRAKIILGSKTFELSGPQIKSLQSMTRVVEKSN